MHIAIISGSNRIGRMSHKVAEFFVRELEARTEVEKVTLLDIHAYDFPVMEERHGRLDPPVEGTAEFSSVLTDCNALIIVTPEYNGGMAGSLKNALDYFRPEFNRKPMTAVTVSSGNFGGVNALHQLWFWMTYNGGIVSPQKLLVSNVNDVFDDAFNAIDERFIRNAGKTIDELLWLAQKIGD